MLTLLLIACNTTSTPAFAPTDDQLASSFLAASGGAAVFAYLATVNAEVDGLAAAIEESPVLCPTIEDAGSAWVLTGGCTSDETGWTYDGTMSEKNFAFLDSFLGEAPTGPVSAEWSDWTSAPADGPAVAIDGTWDGDEGGVRFAAAMTIGALPAFTVDLASSCAFGEDCPPDAVSGAVDGLGAFTAAADEDGVTVQFGADTVRFTEASDGCVLASFGEVSRTVCIDELQAYLEAWPELEVSPGSEAGLTLYGGGWGSAGDEYDFHATVVGTGAAAVTAEVGVDGTSGTELHPLDAGQICGEDCQEWTVTVARGPAYAPGESTALDLSDHDAVRILYRLEDETGAVVSCRYYSADGDDAANAAFFAPTDCPE